MGTPPDFTRRLGNVLRETQDQALGRRAVRAGLLTPQDLADAGGLPVEALLRAKGFSPAQIRRLQAEIDRDDYALFRPDRRPPPEVLAALGEPDRQFAEFVLVSRLGRGGVGEVWKAWDTRLGRWTAVKLPMATPDLEAASDRFTREALAAAKLSHPNIVPIYRVAEEKGRCFIVMQYVEGQTLGRVRPGPREALEILRTVALAVHSAHERGVIHRDLKPANIMIGADGRPFILDFGLAHLQESGSREGLVAGTAAYMSPEQARGEPGARERATDVYSLGATLYELIVGRAPYDGGTFAETLEKVLYRDLVLPRSLNSAIPRDVETIILKAMDKDPRRRYATAKELADDLDRVLRDEPIAARRGSFAGAVVRRLRRHPRVVLIVAASVLIVLGTQVTVRLEARRTERLQREAKLGSVRDLARVSVEAMLGFRRAGANERIAEFLPQLEAACAEAGGDAELDYLLGRAHRTAMSEPQALVFQERALSARSDYVPALYERVVLLSRKGGPRELMVRDLEKLRKKGAGDAKVLAAEGIVAFRGGDHASARKSLEKAVAANPWLEEAWEALGAAILAPVGIYSPADEQDETYQEADRVYSRALDRDRGYAPHWIGRGNVRAARAVLKGETGQDALAEVQLAEDDYAQAMRIAAFPELLRRRALLRARVGAQRMHLGENPQQNFSEAMGDLGQLPAALAAPGRAFVYRCQAEYRMTKGAAPLEDWDEFEKAVSEGGQAVCLERAILWTYRAMHRIGLGEDAAEDFKQAEGLFAQALKDEAQAREAYERRAFLRLQRARHQLKVGDDPIRDLAEAAADLERALDKGVFFPRARLTRARVHRAKGGYLEKTGQDPSGPFAEAQRDVIHVLEGNPISTEAWTERGHLELEWARYRTKRRNPGAARDHSTQAVRSFEEAIRLNPVLTGVLREPLREARRALLGVD